MPSCFTQLDASRLKLYQCTVTPELCLFLAEETTWHIWKRTYIVVFWNSSISRSLRSQFHTHQSPRSHHNVQISQAEDSIDDVFICLASSSGECHCNAPEQITHTART